MTMTEQPKPTQEERDQALDWARQVRSGTRTGNTAMEELQARCYLHTTTELAQVQEKWVHVSDQWNLAADERDELKGKVDVLEQRVKLLQDAIETTIEDPVTRPEVMRHLQRCLDKAKALAEGREEDDTRPLEGGDGNIKCQFCGCLTNAKLRACCEKGREQDLRISESKTKAHVVASAGKDAFLNLFNVRTVLRKAVSLMAEPESIVELAEFVVKELKRAQDGERTAKYDRYVLATEIMGADATLGDNYIPLSMLLSTLRMNAIRLKAWETQKGSTLTVVELEKASNVIRFLRKNFHNDGAEGESVWAACALLEKSLGPK
jgi:hypothetical protein